MGVPGLLSTIPISLLADAGIEAVPVALMLGVALAGFAKAAVYWPLLRHLGRSYPWPHPRAGQAFLVLFVFEAIASIAGWRLVFDGPLEPATFYFGLQGARFAVWAIVLWACFGSTGGRTWLPLVAFQVLVALFVSGALDALAVVPLKVLL